MHAPNAPTPGSTTRGRVGDQRRVGGQPGVGAQARQRLVRRVQVADAVVDDGDHNGRPLRSPATQAACGRSLAGARSLARGCGTSQHALRRRHALGRRLDAHGVAQAAGEPLERRLDDVVHVAPRAQADVQRDRRRSWRTTTRRARRAAGRTPGCRAAALSGIGRPRPRTAGRTGRGRPRRAPRRAGTDRWRSGARRPCRRAPRGTPRRA